MLQALVIAGAHAKGEVCRTLVVLISNEPKLQAYAARQSYRALKDNLSGSSLLLTTLTAWFLGTIQDIPNVQKVTFLFRLQTEAGGSPSISFSRLDLQVVPASHIFRMPHKQGILSPSSFHCRYGQNWTA